MAPCVRLDGLRRSQQRSVERRREGLRAASLRFPSLALPRSGSEGVSHPRLAFAICRTPSVLPMFGKDDSNSVCADCAIGAGVTGGAVQDEASRVRQKMCLPDAPQLIGIKHFGNFLSSTAAASILGCMRFRKEVLMTGEIIRIGDSTSHGGRVLEGSPLDICMGKPIAFVGHKVQCPKCKGVFPIIEGAPTTTFYGKGVALAGMHTACGAVLIASQFTDIVECGGGTAQAKSSGSSANPVVFGATESPGVARTSAVPKPRFDQFDDRFILTDAVTGKPIPFTEYAIRRGSGEIEHGTSDAEGHTHLLSATSSAEDIEIFV